MQFVFNYILGTIVLCCSVVSVSRVLLSNHFILRSLLVNPDTFDYLLATSAIDAIVIKLIIIHVVLCQLSQALFSGRAYYEGNIQ